MASRAIGKGHPRKFDVDRVPGQPKKRRKITLVFDEKKRRDFLGGFHKRKVQRQKKAQEELQQKLKEEKKTIKQDAREKYKTLLSQRDIPELEELLSKQEFEDEDRTVSILELNVADLAQRSNWIGANRPVYEDDSEADSECSEDAASEEEEVAGMELKPKRAPKAIVKRESSSQLKKEPETKKEVARAVKRAALKQVTTSKVFQQKQRLERQKNIKRSNQQKIRQEKLLKKARGKTKKKAARKVAQRF